MNSLKNNLYIRLLKPTHWIKNLLVALPLLMSGDFSSTRILSVVSGIISFSLLSSAVYILNDILDIEYDRMHYAKHKRPLAAAKVPVEKALVLAFLLIGVTFLFHWLMASSVMLLFAYLLLNYFYSVVGKRIRFIDILLLSSFYLIRVIYGGQIVAVELTGWFMATITMAVLAISVHKRYMECVRSEHVVLPGRAYTKEDAVLLRHMMFNFSTMVQVLLNIHAYFVLGISEFYFYCLMNLITAGIILLYFDESTRRSDDPVARILENKKLLVMVFLFLVLYSYEVISYHK